MIKVIVAVEVLGDFLMTEYKDTISDSINQRGIFFLTVRDNFLVVRELSYDDQT